MIIFTDNINIIPYIKNRIVFNLSSAYSGYLDISNLITNVRFVNNPNIPINEYVSTVEFDVYYSSLILNNPYMFSSFMNIMSASYDGNNVVILVHRDYYRDTIMESIIKFIQQRYGYKCWIIEDIDDMESIKESTYTSIGLVVLNEDLKAFIQGYLNGNFIQLYNINPQEYEGQKHCPDD